LCAVGDDNSSENQPCKFDFMSIQAPIRLNVVENILMDMQDTIYIESRARKVAFAPTWHGLRAGLIVPT
jgi:hypothetical protein